MTHTEEEIAKAHAGNVDRKWSLIDFSACKHERTEFLTTRVGYGTHKGWEVVACHDCGQPLEHSCTHPEWLWNDAGTLLSCTLCGLDGT
jgi:hypothetical protein